MLSGRLLAAHDTRHRGVAEGAVTGGMAHRFQHARHSDLVGELQDLGDVIAGGAAMRLDEPVGEGLGDLPEAQKLLLKHVSAGTVLTELALVFRKDVASVARLTQVVARNDLAFEVNIEDSVERHRLDRTPHKRR